MLVNTITKNETVPHQTRHNLLLQGSSARSTDMSEVSRTCHAGQKLAVWEHSCIWSPAL